MAEQYAYRDGFRGTTALAARVVAAELAQLSASGEVTATRVIEAATPAEAPLHLAFEWDDGVAGHQYRLDQARRLIRAVVVIADGAQGCPQSLYVHVPAREQGEGEYVKLAHIAHNPGDYARALEAAQHFLTAAKRRFAELRDVADTAQGGAAEVLAIAAQGFATVQEALDLLKARETVAR